MLTLMNLQCCYLSFICQWLALETLVFDLIRKNMATGKTFFLQNSLNLILTEHLKKGSSKKLVLAKIKKVFKIVSQKTTPLR